MTVNSDWIFDVGLHKGEDTEFYLKKGYRVAAFEANPRLVALCRERFSREIQTGRLLIVEGAIAPRSSGARLRFFVNSKLSVWGTTSPDWARRNENRGAESFEIEVPRVEFYDVLVSLGGGII